MEKKQKIEARKEWRRTRTKSGDKVRNKEKKKGREKQRKSKRERRGASMESNMDECTRELDPSI